ncbi:putative glucarate transporter [Ditylenchus destructor]|nr:putative glucarate transporter [Ditylenchus destructor]
MDGGGLHGLGLLRKGVGALGWAVVSDTSPKQIAGLSGGLFNTFGNLASITTPIVIGYIISTTGSFKWALCLSAPTRWWRCSATWSSLARSSV